MPRPKQASKRTRGKRSRDGRDAIMSAEFKTIASFNRVTTTDVVVQVNHTLSTRMSAMCQLYEFYRYTSILLKVMPHGSAVSTTNVLAYLPVQPGVTTLSGFTDVSQVPTSIAIDGEMTVPVTLRIGRSHLLATPEKWFSTNAGSTAYSPNQGELIMSSPSSITATVYVSIWWRAQFKNATLAALDLSLSLKAKEEEIAELEKEVNELRLTRLRK